MISKEALKLIEAIIEKYGNAIIVKYAGASGISHDDLTVLISEGIIKPEDIEGSAVVDGYLIGKIRGVLAAKKREIITPAEFKQKYRMAESTLNETEKKTVDALKATAFHAMDTFKTEMKTKIRGVLLNVTFENMREYLGEPVKNMLEQSYIENKSLGKLIQDLKKQAGDFSSRWKTLATTEMSKAINAGILDEIVATNKDKTPDEIYITAISVRDNKLCPHCLRLLHNPNGTPKVFKLSEVIANGSNYGKKASDWRPCLDVQHINCRCLWTQLPDGYGFESGSSIFQYMGDGYSEYEKQKKAKT